MPSHHVADTFDLNAVALNDAAISAAELLLTLNELGRNHEIGGSTSQLELPAH